MSAIVAKAPESTFVPMPEGVNEAVLTEVEDLGMEPVPPQFQKPGAPTERPKVRLRFTNSDGLRAGKKYTLSLHEKATLAKDMKSMLGLKELPRELDLTALIGTPAILIVSHTTKNGRTFANVTAISKGKGPKRAVAARPVTPADPIDDSDVGF